MSQHFTGSLYLYIHQQSPRLFPHFFSVASFYFLFLVLRDPVHSYVLSPKLHALNLDNFTFVLSLWYQLSGSADLLDFLESEQLLELYTVSCISSHRGYSFYSKSGENYTSVMIYSVRLLVLRTLSVLIFCLGDATVPVQFYNFI